jgi:hypothetical protein
MLDAQNLLSAAQDAGSWSAGPFICCCWLSQSNMLLAVMEPAVHRLASRHRHMQSCGSRCGCSAPASSWRSSSARRHSRCAAASASSRSSVASVSRCGRKHNDLHYVQLSMAALQRLKHNKVATSPAWESADLHQVHDGVACCCQPGLAVGAQRAASRRSGAF